MPVWYISMDGIALIVKLTQFRITREESHNEELSALGWPVGMPQGGLWVWKYPAHPPREAPLARQSPELHKGGEIEHAPAYSFSLLLTVDVI